MLSSAVQSLNAHSPTVSTLAGITTLLIAEPSNADAPIDSRMGFSLLNITDSRLVQLANALLPIVSTSEEISIVFIFLQFASALSAITAAFVITSSLRVAGTTDALPV